MDLRRPPLVRRRLDPRALADLLWPPRCAACGEGAWDVGALCPRCAGGLPEPSLRCARCGRRAGPHAGHDACPGCVGEDLRLDGVVAAWPYAGAAREIVLSLKYRARFAACGPAAAALAAALRAAGVPGDLLVPVPLSRARRRERGFNQSLLVARALARHLRIDLDARALWRRRHDPPQAGLPRGRRRRNPRGAFLARPRRVRRRSILLVDDVLTTGSTARACAIALRRAGAAAVVAAVLCRAEQR